MRAANPDLMPIPTDWTFKDAGVADGFDRHVRGQLPWYDLAAGATAHIARHYIPEQGVVYDIGASTGNIGCLLADTLTARRVDFRPIDSSPEMAALYTGPGSLTVSDATLHEYADFDVAILFLVMMFIPIAQRPLLLDRLAALVQPGGALIVVDKVNVDGYLGTALRRLTLAGKVATGTSTDDIIAKELSLSGVQRPLSPSDLPGHPQEFFRFGEFVGWVIEYACL